jgi:hypothetical protein
MASYNPWRTPTDGGVDLLDNVSRPLEKFLPGQSRPRAAVCAHKQIGTEFVLEVTKSPAES